MIILSTGAAKALLSAATGFKTAFANGVIKIYDGPQPADADSAKRGNLLGVVTLGGNAFSGGTATNGLNFDAPGTAPNPGNVISKAAAETWQVGDGNGVHGAMAAGTAGWFRLMSNAANSDAADPTAIRIDGSIATAGADLNLPNIQFVVGTPVTVDVFQFTLPLR